MRRRIKDFLKILGPGFVSGAADNDPAGIATYAQIGARFGYGQLWTALFALPLLISVQETCARIGLVTGKGLAKVIREHYSKKLLYFVVAILVMANTINIGADIGAMAAAAQLVVPIPFVFLVLIGVLATLSLEIFASYRIYARYLKWLATVSLVYLATVFVVAEPWGQIIRATFVPHIEFNFTFLLLIAGNIGTTLAPYLFFLGSIAGSGRRSRKSPRSSRWQRECFQSPHKTNARRQFFRHVYFAAHYLVNNCHCGNGALWRRHYQFA